VCVCQIQVSFAKEPYKRDYILQKRNIFMERRPFLVSHCTLPVDLHPDEVTLTQSYIRMNEASLTQSYMTLSHTHTYAWMRRHKWWRVCVRAQPWIMESMYTKWHDLVNDGESLHYPYVCLCLSVCVCVCLCLSVCVCVCVCLVYFSSVYERAMHWGSLRMRDKEHVQPIADRVALNLEIVFKTFPTNQNSARGIYD